MSNILSDELEGLFTKLEDAKAAEKTLKDARIALEEKVISLITNDKEEGGVTVSSDSLSITVTNGITRTIDVDALKEIDDQLPDNLKLLIKGDPKFNLKNLRILEETANEDFLNSINNAITIKPKKVSVTIKRKK